MGISYKNIKKKTPVKLEKIGTAILMLTSGLTPIVASLPISNDVGIWVNATLSALGLGAKVFTMMFAEEPIEEITDGQS